MTAIPDSAKHISVRTFKKDGTPVATPVWFAQLDGKLIVFTDGTSYKVKRLRRDARVEVAVCDARGKLLGNGQWYPGKGRCVEGPSEAAYIERCYVALNRKYGMLMRVGTFFSTLVGRVGRRLILELTLD
ncbi:MAG TPA: PPOX class F420-dependent oxidoreductase [Polyangiales bacterium]|jgi:hypothetical protein|nr:PPOX class F420-dependent oxidoreductase [Polyangiales bacterium]